MNGDSKVLQWLAEGESLPTKEPHEEPPRKSYDKKIVAWLDLLGIRAKIKDEKTNDAESIINIMSQMASYVSSSCDKYMAEGVMSYLQIADGFMLVSDLNYADQVCSIISDIQWKILINLKMLSRGAITAGNVSVANNGSLIIGPAYVDAYAMESENAIYARTNGFDSKKFEQEFYDTTEYPKEDNAFFYADDDIPRRSITTKKFYEEILTGLKEYFTSSYKEQGIEIFVKMRTFLKQYLNKQD